MASVNLLHESNLPKSSLPNNLDRLKVVDAQPTSFQSGKIKSSSGAKLKIAGQALRWTSHKINPLQIPQEEASQKKEFFQPEELCFFCCMLTPLLCSHLSLLTLVWQILQNKKYIFCIFCLYHIFGKEAAEILMLVLYFTSFAFHSAILLTKAMV